MQVSRLLGVLLVAVLLATTLPGSGVSALDVQYHSYDTLIADLGQLAGSHPNIAKMYAIGTTVEGREIAAIKISDNAASDADEGENRVLFVGTHHAREWISLEVSFLLAKYLVEHYDDPTIKQFVDNEEIWVVPLLNADGFEYSRTTDRLWRKNRRVLNPLINCYGVDLNRNYGASKWGMFNNVYNSHSGCLYWTDQYIGPSGFSERETQAIRDFFMSHRIDAVLSYHSYQQKILWPWGYTLDSIRSSADRQFMENLANDMRVLIKQVHNEDYISQQSSKLYQTAGDLTDWAYENYRIPALTIELRPVLGDPAGFVLPTDQITPTFEENLPAALRLLESYRPVVIKPRTGEQVLAGPSTSPRKIFVTVSGIGRGRNRADFAVKIGGQPGVVVSAASTGVNAYSLGIMPPTQPNSGFYDLEVSTGGASTTRSSAVAYADTSNADVVLVVDRSGSMDYSGYLEPAKAAARQFVDFLHDGDKVGVVTFDDYSYVDFPLTAVTGSPSTIFSDDAEHGAANWTASGGWAITTESAHSSTHAWSDSLGGNYPNYSDSRLTLANPLNLTGVADPYLNFWSRIVLEASYDNAFVEASSDGGSTWSTLASYTGHDATWTQRSISLGTYAGRSDVRLRFRLVSDSSVTYDGWYLDDIQVASGVDTRFAAKAAIDAITAGNSTSIGAGLQSAQTQLTGAGSAAHPWAVVLLSDGYENTSPMVASVLPSVVGSKTKVYTVALGPDSDRALLTDTAAQTGGSYSYAPTADRLAEIYNTITGQVAGQQVLLSQSGSVNPGTTDEKSIVVDQGLAEATFSVTWSISASPLTLTLVLPNGLIVDPTVATADPNIDYYSGSTYAYYRIQTPVAGTWKARVTGSAVSTQATDDPRKRTIEQSTSQQSYNLVVTGTTNTTLSFELDQGTYRPGDHVLLSAVLADDIPITGASVTVTATLPAAPSQAQQWVPVRGDTKPLRLSTLGTAGSIVVTLYDDGQHGDGVANDGVYANSFANSTVPGLYQFDLTASGVTNHGSSFTRGATATMSVVTQPIPKLAVTASPQLQVRAGETTTGSFTIANNGSQWDTITLRVGEHETMLRWADTSSIPRTVSLGPSQSISFDVPIRVPGDTPKGSSFVLIMTAISQTDASVSDTASLAADIPVFRTYVPYVSRR